MFFLSQYANQLERLISDLNDTMQSLGNRYVNVITIKRQKDMGVLMTKSSVGDSIPLV